MNEIHFIKNLHFDGELWCNSFGKAAKPFMRQGELDSACAVYSLMMMLVLHEKVKPTDLTKQECTPGRTSVRRLQDQFLYGLPGLYRGGYDFKTLRDELHSCFKSRATATSYCTYKKRDDYVTKDELNKLIMETIDKGYPVEVGYTVKGPRCGHAMVAIGYQLYKDRMLLFCLDPGFDLPRTAFWNSILDIQLEADKRMKYTADYIPSAYWQDTVNVDEILIID